MNKQPGSDNFNDEDIAGLFQKQATEFPVELDAAILEAAENALTQSTRTQATPEQSVVDRDPLDHISQTAHPVRNWTPHFATAAVVVLAVTLVPMVLYSPDQQVQNTVEPALSVGSGAEPVAESAADAAVSEVRISTPASARNSPSEKALKAELISEESAKQSITQSTQSVETDQSQIRKVENLRALLEAESESRESMRLRSPANELAHTAVEESAASDSELLDDADRQKIIGQKDFRKTTDHWIDEILRLHGADNLADAIVEYTLFARVHPEFAEDVRLPRRLLEPERQ